MKLVVDNSTPGPAKRTSKAHHTSPFLIAKLTSEGGAKNSVVRDFQRFLEARAPARSGNIDRNGSDSKELQEQPPVEWVERNYLDTMPFGNLFEDLERKYEKDLKEAVPLELHKSDGILVQDMKFIDARSLFANLRLDREASDSELQGESGDTASSTNMSLPSSVKTLAAVLSFSGESRATNEKRSMGAYKQQAPVPENPQAGIVTPQEFSRIENQRPFADSPAENAEPLLETAAAQGKTAETNSPPEASATRLEAPSALAAAPSPRQQIVERVTKMLPAQSMDIRHLADGQKTVRFALQPESLGDVSVVLRLRDSGVDLAIRPQRRETAQYLENSRDELLQSLKLTGVELGTVEIRTLDETAGQDVRQDRPGTGQSGGQTSQFQSPQGGNPFHGGGRENQWRASETIAARKGNKDETEQPDTGGSAVGRGIIL